MPAALIPFRSPAAVKNRATWWLLEIAPPGLFPEPLGILLVDEAADRLTLRLRDAREFDAIEEIDEESHDFLAALGADLASKAEAGGMALLLSLEDSLSGLLRLGDRNAIEYSGKPSATVSRLFDEHVRQAGPAEILPFVTHLPCYGLRAAATRFGEEFAPADMSEPDAWVPAPRGLRLTEGMFVAQVVGRSMEPLIPDGSYCVFRGPVTGSRQGKRLLIEQTNSADPAARYTVKRYTSRKTADPDGGWRHESIRLEPLNPEFEAFELGAGDFRVIAEFVQVLPL